jgi:hypothetical protein
VALVAAVVLTVMAVFAGVADSSRASAEYGVLQQFAPRSASTWWAIVDSNLHPQTWVVRTTDSGKHWRAVTPPVQLVASAAFLGRDIGWVEANSLHAGAPGSPKTEPVYRTLDGGRTWQRLGSVKSGCELDFVDRKHGWCTEIGNAMGASVVWVYRTSNGGSTWRLVSRTGLAGRGSTRGALPYPCDKSIDFTSSRVGWAAQFCNGGRARLYTTTDGGARWHGLAVPGLPRGAPSTYAGRGISIPAVHGSQLAVSLSLDGAPRITNVIATSTTHGNRWQSRLAPGTPQYGPVDLIDTKHFVVSNGTTLLATSNAGHSWNSLRATKRFVKALGTPLTPDFLSPRLGFVTPTDHDQPIWWTSDRGRSWKAVKVTAGPFTVG